MTYTYNQPIHKCENSWYFWDETWAYRHGPYASKKECEIKLSKYAKWLDTGDYVGNWDDPATPLLNLKENSC